MFCCGADAERRRMKLKQKEKDAEAMSLMQKMRVTWTSEEDSLVCVDAMLCLVFAFGSQFMNL